MVVAMFPKSSTDCQGLSLVQAARPSAEGVKPEVTARLSEIRASAQRNSQPTILLHTQGDILQGVLVLLEPEESDKTIQWFRHGLQDEDTAYGLKLSGFR